MWRRRFAGAVWLASALGFALVATPAHAASDSFADGPEGAMEALRGASRLVARELAELGRAADVALERAVAGASALASEGRAPEVRVAAVEVQGGLDRQVVLSALRRQGALADVRRCVAALPRAERPSTLELRWFDGGRGIPQGAALVGAAQPRLRRCVTEAVAGWRFPQPRCTAIIRVRVEVHGDA